MKKETSRLINKAEIARQLGYSQPYISMILSGKRKAPKVKERINELLQKSLKAA